MTQVTSYLFVTVMIRDMIVEIIPILGYEVTPCKHTGHLEKNYCYKTIRTRHFKCASSDMNLMWKYSCKCHRCLLPPSQPFPPSLLPLPLRLPMDRLLHPPPPPPLRSPQSHAHFHCNPLPLRLPGEKLLLIIKCARSNMIFMWK